MGARETMARQWWRDHHDPGPVFRGIVERMRLGEECA